MSSTNKLRPEIYIKQLTALYTLHADEAQAAGAKAYMRDQFDHFGLDTPTRRVLTKKFIEEYGVPEDAFSLARTLWKMPQRELQYFAMEILEKRTKEFSEKDIVHLEYMIVHKSWWDSIDFIAPKLVGPLFKKHPQLIKIKIKEWIRSKNIWLMRSALLFQMKYKKETDEALLFSTIEQCAYEPDFFIRKAIGWTLREHSKTFPASVKRFVKENAALLSPLSKKEALKRIA